MEEMSRHINLFATAKMPSLLRYARLRTLETLCYAFAMRNEREQRLTSISGLMPAEPVAALAAHTLCVKQDISKTSLL